MVDYQFLAVAAVVFAVLSRGSLLAVLAMTACIALVMVAYEAAARRPRRRTADEAGHRFRRVGGDAPAPAPSDDELVRWVAVVDRVLRSPD